MHGRFGSEMTILSEQTVDAMLRVRDLPLDQSSVVTEDRELGSVCSPQSPGPVESPASEWPAIPERGSGQEVPPKSEVQLRYLLQLFVEAGCLDWASVVAITLKDAMAIVRIANAARSSVESSVTVQRLYE